MWASVIMYLGKDEKPCTKAVRERSMENVGVTTLQTLSGNEDGKKVL